MKNIIAIGLATITVLLNGWIGHFYAPNGITLTPIVLIITTLLVCFGTKNINVIFMCVLVYLFIGLNDILIKLYSGGSHDIEGRGWIHLYLFVGLFPTFGILIAAFFNLKNETERNKRIAAILFVGLIVLHLIVFSNLGLGRCYLCE